MNKIAMHAAKSFVAVLVFCALLPWVQAANLVQIPPTAIHPWQAAVSSSKSEAYFTNLKDGDTVQSPFRVAFGLSGGWGLAPISKPINGKTGHHHLLIDKKLPLNIADPIPFSEQYVHFGKGQMETVLSLKPGKHTLRLLLANENHVLHFIYSEPITVNVTAKNESIDPKTLQTKGVRLLSPSQDAKLKGPFRVQFHASGFNVAHLAQKEKDTGHFRLTVMPHKRGYPAVIAYENGQTETWLTPPAGLYTLKLELMDNLAAGKVLSESAMVVVAVE